jgi:cysteine-rich repeat protein
MPLDFGRSETQYNGDKTFLDSKIASCGDGVIDLGEKCDDGNTIDELDGCSHDCMDNEKCGDSKVDPLEQCDDGTKNGTPGDACDADCQKIPPKVAEVCTLEAELQNKEHYTKPISLLDSFVFKFTDTQPDATPQPIVPDYVKPYTSVTAANHTDVFRILAVGGNANCYFDPKTNHFKIINFLDMPQWVAIYLTNPLHYNCEYRFTMRTGLAITEGGKCLKSFDDFTFSTGDDPNAPAAPWVFHMFQMKVPPSMNFIAIPPK